jgi:uncharacterized membrane protein
MGRRVSDFQHHEPTADVPGWLKTMVADRADELDKEYASDEEEHSEQVYLVRRGSCWSSMSNLARSQRQTSGCKTS